MERVSRLILVILTILLVAIALEVKVGGRSLKNKDDEVVQPQNFFAGFGTFPSPGLAAGFGFGFGPSGFCSFPGIGCVRVQPTNPKPNPSPAGSLGDGLP